MLNTDSRRRSAVGRISRVAGEARLRPLNRPPTTRTELLVLRLEIALAVIAALDPLRRTVAGVFLFAAAALYQHAAALAVGDQCALALGLERLLAARRFVFLAGLVLLRPREIRTRKRRNAFAELFAQHPRLDLL